MTSRNHDLAEVSDAVTAFNSTCRLYSAEEFVPAQTACKDWAISSHCNIVARLECSYQKKSEKLNKPKKELAEYQAKVEQMSCKELYIKCLLKASKLVDVHKKENGKPMKPKRVKPSTVIGSLAQVFPDTAKLQNIVADHRDHQSTGGRSNSRDSNRTSRSSSFKSISSKSGSKSRSSRSQSKSNSVSSSSRSSSVGSWKSLGNAKNVKFKNARSRSSPKSSRSSKGKGKGKRKATGKGKGKGKGKYPRASTAKHY